MPHRHTILPILTSILVALSGAVSLAQVLTIHIRHRQFGGIDDSLLPFTTAQSSRLLILLTGLLLLYLSLQIYRRKRMAYDLTMAGLLLLIGAELVIYKNVAQLVFYGVILLLLILTNRQYTVETNNLSLRRGAGVAAMVMLVVFVYATVGFSELNRHEIGTSISLPTAAKYAAREIFTFQESQVPLRSRRAKWFVGSVDAAAVAAYGMVVLSLFRPLAFRYGASRHDQELARRILEKSSTSTEDYFKLWPPDKHYFFSAERDSFIAYKVVGSDALVLGSPSGNPANFSKLIETFGDFASRSGWAVSYISTSDEFDSYIAPDTYRRLFIGNEAIIDIATFAESTYRSKHFRYIRNRSERDGLTFEYWPAPLSAMQVMKLRRISNAWLGQGGRREYTFALGYFHPDYIRSCDVAVLMKNDKAVAYANILPGFSQEVISIDHMRYTDDMPPTGMHYLLMQLLLRLHEQGARKFNLGLSPLSGIEDRDKNTMPERLLTALKKLGGAYYSFSGLEQFKNKFEPDWQARYIYYQGAPTRLIGAARNLNRAVTLPVAGRTRRVAIGIMSVVAAIGYASFPFGFLTNPPRAIHGLASQLGSAGQPYAGLFNGLDILSGLLLLTIIGLLWARLRPEAQLSRIMLICFGVGAISTMFAAAAPLPRHTFSVTQVELHDIFSALSLLGFTGAAFCFVRLRSAWLHILGWLLYAMVAAIALSVIYQGTFFGSISQRLQIILTAIWMIIISLEAVREPKRYSN